ncbi:hypothetical protein BC629DRAFT_1590080 [Irpex lacteus]|nr:hypothetical protein BC629DRAFT_1590080 [Irpex lacteus]
MNSLKRLRKTSPEIRGPDDQPRKRWKEEGLGMAMETGKLLLAVVARASDALPPLKGAISGLEFVIEHLEKVGDIKMNLTNLLERIEKIHEMLSSGLCDNNERKGRETLDKELQRLTTAIKTMKDRPMWTRVIKAKNDAARMAEYINEVERALFDYQLSLTQGLYSMNLAQLNNDELAILTRLIRAPDAGFEGSDDRTRCLAGTRIAVLRDLAAWAADPSALQLFWLYGLAGSGKSTIAQSFAESLVADRKLGASFFCSRNSQKRGDLKMIFPTLAFQLARADNPRSMGFRVSLLRTLKAYPDIASASMVKQLELLLVVPAQESGIDTIVVLDALDECKDERTTSIILELLSKSIQLMPSLKFFITSRPDSHIRSGFRLQELRPITEVMILHEVGATSVHADIGLFLRTRLTSIAASRSDLDLSEQWPQDHDIEALTKKASGLFIFASTVVKYIESGNHDPKVRLRELLDKAAGSQGEGLSGLDELYYGILNSAVADLAHDEHSLQRLRSILGLLVVAIDPLPGPAIADMLGITWFNVKTSLRPLHSLLIAADSRILPVRFCHKSFPDFLTDRRRCRDERLFVHGSFNHLNVTQYSFVLMESSLKKNICRLPRYSSNSTLDRSLVEQTIGEALRYSCRHWATHISLSGSSPSDHLQVVRPLLHRFLATRQLHWFEVLSLLQELWRAHISLKTVIEWLNLEPELYQDLLPWARDGYKFVLYASDLISDSVSHIYHSALPMAPETSLLKKSAWEDLRTEIKVLAGVRLYWSDDAHLRTLYSASPIEAIHFSQDSSILAICARCNERTVCIDVYRPTTGEKLTRLSDVTDNGENTQDHQHNAILSFSPDNRTLAVITEGGRCVVIWDAVSGASVARLAQPTGYKAHSLAFHPDIDNLLLCGMVGDSSSSSCKQLILVWHSVAHTYQTIFEQNQLQPHTLPLCWLRRTDSPSIVVGSLSGKSRVWQVEPPNQVQVLNPPSYSSVVIAVASSTDGALVASSFLHSLPSVAVYDMGTGELLYSLRGLVDPVQSLQFVPTARAQRPALTLVSRSTLHLSHLCSGDPTESVTGLTSKVKFNALSNGRGGVKPYAAELSSDGKCLAVRTESGTVELWDASRVQELASDTLQGHDSTRLEHANAISENAAYSSDGQSAAAIFTDGTIRVSSFGAGRDIARRTARARVNKIAFLRDNRHIIYCDRKANSVFLWDLARDVVGPSKLSTKHTKQRRGGTTAAYYITPEPQSHRQLGCVCITTSREDYSARPESVYEVKDNNGSQDEDVDWITVQCWAILDMLPVGEEEVVMTEVARGSFRRTINSLIHVNPQAMGEVDYPLKRVLPPAWLKNPFGVCYSGRRSDSESQDGDCQVALAPLLSSHMLPEVEWSFCNEEWAAHWQDTSMAPLSLELPERHDLDGYYSSICPLRQLLSLESHEYVRKIRLTRVDKGETVLQLPVGALRWAHFGNVRSEWDTANRLRLDIQYPNRRQNPSTKMIVDFADVNLDNDIPF